MKRLSFATLWLAASLLAGCGEDPTGPSVESGSLSFRYTGGLPGALEGGAFSASGAPGLDARGRPELAEWAVAGSHPMESHTVPVGSKLAVVAFAPGGSPEGDLVVLTLPRVSGRTSVQIEGNCTSVNCTQGLILLGVSPRTPHEGLEGSCTLGTGTVQITSVAGGRVAGTFSATGRCTRSLRDSPFFDLVVQEGQFDVEISEAFRSGLEIWS